MLLEQVFTEEQCDLIEGSLCYLIYNDVLRQDIIDIFVENKILLDDNKNISEVELNISKDFKELIENIDEDILETDNIEAIENCHNLFFDYI